MSESHSKSDKTLPKVRFAMAPNVSNSRDSSAASPKEPVIFPVRQKFIITTVQEVHEWRTRKATCQYTRGVGETQRRYWKIKKAVKTRTNAECFVEEYDGRSIIKRLTFDEENLMKNGAIEFQRNDTPLGRNFICDLTNALVGRVSQTPEGS